MSDEKLKTSWRDTTRNMLNNRPAYITLPEISKGTGLQLRWLQLFQGDAIKGPDVNKIETLYEFLSAIKTKTSVRNIGAKSDI